MKDLKEMTLEELEELQKAAEELKSSRVVEFTITCKVKAVGKHCHNDCFGLDVMHDPYSGEEWGACKYFEDCTLKESEFKTGKYLRCKECIKAEKGE